MATKQRMVRRAVEVITPAMAAVALVTSRQSFVYWEAVEWYAAQYAAAWQPGRERRPVVFVWTRGRWRLANGNHRMLAIVRHGEPVQLLVERSMECGMDYASC